MEGLLWALRDGSVLLKRYFELFRDHFGQCAVKELLCYSGITLVTLLWKSYFGLLRDHSGECAVEELLCVFKHHFGQCAVEELLWAIQGSLWPVCCGRATLGYSGMTLGTLGWECAVEELLWATQGSLWPVCCGRATLGYSGITLASALWKSYFGVLWKSYFGYSGITLASVLWKSYFGLSRDHFGQCAVEELLWASQCCGRASLG